MGSGNLGCGAKLAKCFLFVFNVIFFVLGAACLAVGIWILVDKPSLLQLTSMVDSLENTNAVGLLEGSVIGLIAGGSFVFVIGFLGCCGALKEIKCLLYLYAFFVLLILLGEIAAGVLGFVYKDKVESELKVFLQRTITERYDGSFDSSGAITTSEVYSLAWEFVHWQFKCCGINGSTNFLSATNWNRTVTINGVTTTLNAPFTCCKTDSSALPSNTNAFTNLTMCVQNISDTRYSNAETGCYDAVKSKIAEYSYVVIGVGIGIAVVEIIGILAACCLIKAINKDSDGDKKKS